MSARHLSARVHGGVLTVTLDTPACKVNIFGQQAAVELIELLAALDSSVRVVVLRSAKPASFINGASLMLGSAASKPDDLGRLTATLRRAYDTLGAVTVPTIAAMRGNCYGCGVELSLRCRYRVAGDAYDAHVYMPEIADYLLVPTFGATQRLPRLLGLEGATDLLLWGQRWSSAEALQRGLLDARFADSEFDAEVEVLASELATTGRAARLAAPARRPADDPSEFLVRTRRRIVALPALVRKVYDECFELLESADREGASSDGAEAEIAAAGRTAIAPISKAASAFFFLREMADLVCARGGRLEPELRVHCDLSAAGPRWMRETMEPRRIRGVAFEDYTQPWSAGALRIVGEGAAGAEPDTIVLVDHIALAGRAVEGGALLYAPLWRAGRAFAEVACAQQSRASALAFQFLTRGGVRCVVTRCRDSLLTDDLLLAYLGPQIAALRGGIEARDLGATLHEFGFTRLAGDIVAGLDHRALAAALGGNDAGTADTQDMIAALPRADAASGGAPRDDVRHAVLGALTGLAHRALRDKAVAHPSIVDVAAREVLDFPIARTSLCRYATAGRAREMAEGLASAQLGTAAGFMGPLKEYVERGQSFYQ